MVVEAVLTEAAPPVMEAAVVVEAVVTEAAPPEVEAAVAEAAPPEVEAVLTEAAPPEVEAVVTEAAVVIDELRTPPPPPPPHLAAPAPEGRVLPPMARRRPTRVRSNSDLRDAVADAVARAAAQGPLLPRGPDEEYEETSAEMAQSSALWPESPGETPSSEEATSVLGAPISPATDEQPTFGPPASATIEPEVDPYEEFARLAAEHAIADTAPRVHYGRLPIWKPVAAPPAEEAVAETAEEAAEETAWLAPAEAVDETAEEAAAETAWLAPAEAVAEAVDEAAEETAEAAAEATAWLAPAEAAAETAEEAAWLAPAEVVAEAVDETAAEVSAVLEEAPADSELQDWAPEVSAPEDLAPEVSAPSTPEVESHEPETPGIEESAWPFGERRSAARQARKPLPAALQEAVAAGAAQELAASQAASGQHTDTTDDQKGGPGSATGTTKSGGKGPGTGKRPGIIRRYGSAIAIVVLFLAAGGAAAGIAAFRGAVTPGPTTAAKDQVAANRDVLTTDNFPPSWRVSPGASAASTYGLGAPLVTHSAVRSWSAGHPACAGDVNAVSAAMTPTVGDVTAVAYTQATARNPLGGLWQIADAVAFHTSAAQVSAEMTGVRSVLAERKAQLCLVQFWSTALQAQFPSGSLVMMTVSPVVVPSLPGKPLAWAMAMSGTAIFGQTALPLSFEITSFAAGRAQVYFVVSSKSANLPNSLDARLLVTLATQAERQNSSTS